MLHLSKRIHLKCSVLSFSRFRTVVSSDSWSFPSCCVPASSEDFTPTNTATSSSDSSSLYTSTPQSGPSAPLLMQLSHPIFAFKPFMPLPPTLYLLPLHLHHCPTLLSVSLPLLLPLFPLTLSGFFNGMLGVSKPGALNFYTLFRLIPLSLFVSRNLILTHLSVSGSLDSLL